jgi:hypothetical protein
MKSIKILSRKVILMHAFSKSTRQRTKQISNGDTNHRMRDNNFANLLVNEIVGLCFYCVTPQCNPTVKKYNLVSTLQEHSYQMGRLLVVWVEPKM